MPRDIPIGNSKVTVTLQRNDWDTMHKAVKSVFDSKTTDRIYRSAVARASTKTLRLLRTEVKAKHNKYSTGKNPRGEKRKKLYQTGKRKYPRVRFGRRSGNPYQVVGFSAFHTHLVEYGTYRQNIPGVGKKAKGGRWVAARNKSVMSEFMRTGKKIVYPRHYRKDHARGFYTITKAKKRAALVYSKWMARHVRKRMNAEATKAARKGNRGFHKDLL